jgi:DNA-binding MarR family transcriptional regulator
MLRFDERSPASYASHMPNAVRQVQRWYPQIYLACHVDHKRPRSTQSGISPRESSLLAHLDERVPVTPADLARHLGVGAPTLSAALKRLARLGYVARDRDPKDSRRQQIRLTPAGARAMSDGSVLDTSRVVRLLNRLTPAERVRALDGLGLLARAAREIDTER